MAEPLPSRVSIPPDVLSRELDEELVLLKLDSDSYYGLDETAAQIWKGFERDGDVEKVLETLLEQYDIDESTLRSDTLDLISKLAELGLVEVEFA